MHKTCVFTRVECRQYYKNIRFLSQALQTNTGNYRKLPSRKGSKQLQIQYSLTSHKIASWCVIALRCWRQHPTTAMQYVFSHYLYSALPPWRNGVYESDGFAFKSHNIYHEVMGECTMRQWLLVGWKVVLATSKRFRTQRYFGITSKNIFRDWR